MTSSITGRVDERLAPTPLIARDRGSCLLSRFVRSIPAEATIGEILDHLVGSVVDVAPHVRVAAAAVAETGAPERISVSDQQVRHAELFDALDCGPWARALRSREPVLFDDLGTAVEVPVFAERARSAGFRAVSTFPLVHDDDALGVLSLYRAEAGALLVPDVPTVQVLSDITASHLRAARARDRARSDADRFEYLAVHDPLTGLPNRQLLETRVEGLAQCSGRTARSALVMFVDLDRLKVVNDTFGHAAGDELLVGVARRLSVSVRPGDMVARVSGDEFVVLCEDVDHPDDVPTLTRRIMTAFATPFRVAGREIPVSGSVGVAHARPGDEISMQLVADADADMYRRKQPVRWRP